MDTATSTVNPKGGATLSRVDILEEDPPCKKHYIASGKKFPVILAMAEGNNLVNVETDPVFTACKRKNNFSVSAKLLKDEIL